MSFFEPVTPRPRQSEPVEPEWYGPPSGVIGGVSTTRVALAKTEDVAIVAHRFLGFPTGVEFTLQLWMAEDRSAHRRPYGLFPPPEEATDGDLRFGVQFPDGSRWTSQAMWVPRSNDDRPPQPMLSPRSGGGSARSWRQGLWMWPLPGEGTLTFVVAWPAEEIDERAVSIDTADLRRAAREAKDVWER